MSGTEEVQQNHDVKPPGKTLNPLHGESDAQEDETISTGKESRSNSDSDGELFLKNNRNSTASQQSAKSRPSTVYDDDPEDAKDRKSVLFNVAGYILVTEFCERLAYYGFAGSLVLFFQTQLNYSNAEADEQFSAWAGLCYLTPLLGGYMADTYWGRYKTILVCCSIYLVGLVMGVIATIPTYDKETSTAIFFPAIYIIALGTGGIKPNVSTMGADQFDDRYSKDRKEKESFFNWFYWSINLGAMIAYLGISYICQYGVKGLGGEEWRFTVGYTIPAVAMFMAICIFLLGTPRYKISQPNGSLLARAVRICKEAVWTNRKTQGTRHILDKAKTSFGGSFSKSQVEAVKLVTRLTPFLGIMVPYWGIYSQMSTAFQNQGCQMNLSIGKGMVPVSALNVFDTIAILALVPLFDGYVYPYFKKIGYPLTMLQKIGAGFFCACLAMVIAAVIEILRLKEAPAPGNYYDESARNNISPCQSVDDYNPYQYQQWYAGDNVDEPQNCWKTCDTLNDANQLALSCISCDVIPQMSNLSVFWQIPQFTMIGMSEVLASISSLEFFYTQAPPNMRSVTQSLNLLTTALGSFMVIPLLLLVNSNPSNEWVPENLDQGHLDLYFLLLASLMALTMVVLYYLAHNYEYKKTSELTIGEDNERRDSSSRPSEADRVDNSIDLVGDDNDAEQGNDNASRRSAKMAKEQGLGRSDRGSLTSDS